MPARRSAPFPAVLLGVAALVAPGAEAAPRFRAPTIVLPVPATYANDSGHLDVDADGREDIAAGSSSGLHLFRLLPGGEYAAPIAILPGSSIRVLGVGSANGDAASDVLVREALSGTDQRIRALLNVGGALVPSPDFAVTALYLRFAVADFNADGRLDVVASNDETGVFDLLLNDGAGGFGIVTPLTSPFTGAASVAHAVDLDGDGPVDLVLYGEDGGGSIAFLPGLGNGTFGAPQVGLSSFPMVLDEFDAAPGLDGIFTDVTTVSFRSGDGLGAFGPTTPIFPGVLTTTSAAGGDLDGDGNRDMAAIFTSGQEVVRVALGQGDGTFGPGLDYPAGTLPLDAEIADLDGDARPDIMVSAILSSMISVLPGNGDGSFGGPRALTTPNLRDVALADLDRDGDLDAVTVDEVTGQLTRWSGGGDGRFTSAGSSATGTGAISVATGNLDADLFPDVLVPVSGFLKVFRNDGAGGLLAPTSVVIAGTPRSLATGDLDGDGDLDVVVPSNSSSTVTVLLGDGLGGFTAAAPVVAAAGNVNRTAIARLDGDAIPDLALANGAQVLVYSGVGNGTFAADPLALPAGDTAGTIEAVDGDGDGDTDLFAVLSNTFTVASWRNDGGGSFAPRVNLATRPYTTNGASTIDLRVRDFDGDGAVDIFAVPAWSSRATGLLAGTTPGSFAPIQILGGGYSGQAVDAGDVDGDGDLDLVVAGRGSTNPFIAPGSISTYLNLQDLVGVPGGGTRATRPGVALLAAWPSPARGSFAIRYRLAYPAPTRVDVFSVSGRRVAGVDEAAATAGEHVARLDGLGRMPAGVYTVVVAQGGERAARKVVLLP